VHWLAAVISSSRKPVSAKQNFSPPRSRGFIAFCPLLGFALLLWPSQLRAESLEDAAHQLAMKVCTTARKQLVKVQWQEPAESPAYLSDSRKKIFLDQISACGIEPTDSAAPVLNVSIRVTASRALLIADSPDAVGGRQTYMIEVPRASEPRFLSLLKRHQRPSLGGNSYGNRKSRFRAPWNGRILPLRSDFFFC
jgi:hypothetical protein